MNSYLRINVLGAGPRLMKKRMYRNAVSQRSRYAGLDEHISQAVIRATALWEERNVGLQMAHARPVWLEIRYLSSGSLLCVFPRDRWVNGEARAIGAFLGYRWVTVKVIVFLCKDARFKHHNAPSKVCLQFYWQILVHVNLVEADKITGYCRKEFACFVELRAFMCTA